MNIKTLFITKEVPYPIRGGVSLRNWQNMNIMMELGSVAVFSAANWHPNYQSLPGIDSWRHCNVEEQRSRWEQWNRKLWWLRPLGEPDADWAYAKLATQELRRFMREFNPDLVIIEQVWLYPYLSVVREFPCRVIFDNHNIEALLLGQHDHSQDSFRTKLKAKIQQNHLARIERLLTQKSDQVWVCSEEDAQLSQQIYTDKTPCYVVPNGVNVPDYDAIRSGQCSPPPELANNQQNILFLGQLSYYPNTVAAERLIDQIYPRIKEIYPNCRLLLVGRVPTQKMLDAAQKDKDIIVTGSVPDVKPYLAAASLMLVPLLHGGGTRLKILEAFAAGCPVISTTKGAEGLKANDGEHLLIRDTIDEMIQGIDQLWSSPTLATQLADAAYQLVQEEYSWEANSQRVEKFVEQLL